MKRIFQEKVRITMGKSSGTLSRMVIHCSSTFLVKPFLGAFLHPPTASSERVEEHEKGS